MGKDREGNFHPPKGKPSGANKSEGAGMQPTPPDEMDEYKKITEKYMEGEDDPADNVHQRHANRNTSKGENSYKDKANDPEPDSAIREKGSEKEEALITPQELPTALSRDVFRELGTHTSEWCIAIFMNTHSSGMEVNEGYDSVNFKNTLQEVEQQLRDKNADTDMIAQMLAPGYSLAKDRKFWIKMKQGLGVFISEGEFKYISMLNRPGNKIVVEKTWYMLPLLPVVLNEKHYYVLTLSKDRCRFYKGNVFGLEHLLVEDMPESLRDEIADRGVSTTVRNSGSGGNSSYHGVGDGDEDDKIYLTNYLRKVDDALQKQVLNEQRAPVFLIGVEYVIALFEDITRYQYVWKESIQGNYDHKSVDELFQMTIDKMQPWFHEDEQKALARFGDLSSTSQSSSHPDEVISAAYYGRVSELFVNKGVHIWGTFDAMNDTIAHLQKDDENAEDLVDNTVVQTILKGGEVYLLESNMPGGAAMAATFRY